MAKKRRQKKRDTRRKERISERKTRRSERQKLLKGASARADRRIKLKETQADTQKELAKTVNQPSATDEALTKALTETPVATVAPIGSGIQNDPTTTTSSTGMSKKTKTILIVGGVLVALTATFLIIRKMRKK
jgi:hypothetical protein